jgi:hypothetical protein
MPNGVVSRNRRGACIDDISAGEGAGWRVEPTAQLTNTRAPEPISIDSLAATRIPLPATLVERRPAGDRDVASRRKWTTPARTLRRDVSADSRSPTASYPCPSRSIPKALKASGEVVFRRFRRKSGETKRSKPSVKGTYATNTRTYEIVSPPDARRRPLSKRAERPALKPATLSPSAPAPHSERTTSYLPPTPASRRARTSRPPPRPRAS